MQKTRLSNKGQIVIPKPIRAAHGWKSGLEFVVKDTEEGIFLKPIKPFRQTGIEDVVGCTGYRGPRKSLEEMDAAIARGAKDSHGRR